MFPVDWNHSARHGRVCPGHPRARVINPTASATISPGRVSAAKKDVDALGITDVERYRNAQGNPIATGALRLRPRDLAKIGQLVLQRGAWNGTQIVAASWIDAATTPQINVLGFNSFFVRCLLDIGRVDVEDLDFSPQRPARTHSVQTDASRRVAVPRARLAASRSASPERIRPGGWTTPPRATPLSLDIQSACRSY
jgi:hypothetical protein